MVRRDTRRHRVRDLGAFWRVHSSRRGGRRHNTVTKLLEDVGTACLEYQDVHLRNLPCKRVQCDEAWDFRYAKRKNVATAKAAPADAGEV